MKTLLIVSAVALAACARGVQPSSPPTSRVCLTGARVPVDESFIDYGTVYGSGVDGPASPMDDLVLGADAGCAP
jgi:hypothetical protein